MTGNPAYLTGLDRNQANYAPLTPLTFLERAAYVHPTRVAVVHGALRFTWAETYARCRRLASALTRHGIGRNDTVAVMAPNIPAIYEAHFGVPMAGAVLNTLNTRLDPETIAFMLRHGGARVLITDGEFAPTVEKALALLEKRPLVIDIDDPAYPNGRCVGDVTYEAFLAEGDPNFAWTNPADEWDAIALNYTSGTTGDPKGVVYHHRGAHLNAISNVLNWDMPSHPVYLWTLPMFHCNGWCFPWSVAERAGTNVCLRRVEATAMFDAIRQQGHAYVRRADRLRHADQRAGGAAAGYSPHGARPSRWRCAACGDHRGRGKDRHRTDACLWVDGDIWASLSLRKTWQLGGDAVAGSGRAQWPAGRTHAAAGGDDRARFRNDAAGAVGRRDDGRDHVPR